METMACAPRVDFDLHQAGIASARQTTPRAAANLEEAKQRCIDCNAKALCDEALASRSAQALSRFCPNTHYLARVRNGRP
jgi:hypothetical protein